MSSIESGIMRIAGLDQRLTRRAVDTTPADRARAEEALISLHGEPSAPPVFVWVDSPLAGAIAASILTRAGYALRRTQAGAPLELIARRASRRITRELSVEMATRFGRTSWHFRLKESIRQAMWTEPLREPTERLQAELVLQTRALPDHGVIRRASSECAPAREEIVALAGLAGAGQHEGVRVAWLHLLKGLGAGGGRLQELDVISGTAGWWWVFEGICVVAERPVRHEEPFLLRYRDGFSCSLASPPPPGDRSSRRVVMAIDPHAPEGEVTPARFSRWAEAVVESGAARCIDRSGESSLYTFMAEGQERVVFLRVVCPSTRQRHYLRVPPHLRRGHEAVAWTFNVPPALYRPREEA